MIRSVGIIVLVLTLAFEPLVTAGPLWIKETAKANGAKNVLKKIGSALCRAAYDNSNPSALTEAIEELGKMDQAEIESVNEILKKFGSNLCDYVTDSSGSLEKLTAQVLTSPPFFPQSSTRFLSILPQKRTSAEVQGRASSVFDKIGSALCRAAYNNDNPNALSEAFPEMSEVETQGVKEILKRFGSNLCDYVTGSGDKITKQRAKPRKTVSKNKGILRKIGSALCRAAYNSNPRAAAQLMGATNEVEVQQFTDFLKRFGSNLCDYVTDDRQSNVNGGRSYVELQWSNAQKQSFLNTAKKVGSALCRAAYNPTALAQNAVSQGVMNQAEAQKFKKFLKRFGANLCDYITQDTSGNGSVKAMEQDLLQELEAAAK